MGALSAFFNDSLDIKSPESRELACTRMVDDMKYIHSISHEHYAMWWLQWLNYMYVCSTLDCEDADDCGDGIQDSPGTAHRIPEEWSDLRRELLAHDVRRSHRGLCCEQGQYNWLTHLLITIIIIIIIISKWDQMPIHLFGVHTILYLSLSLTIDMCVCADSRSCIGHNLCPACGPRAECFYFYRAHCRKFSGKRVW